MKLRLRFHVSVFVKRSPAEVEGKCTLPMEDNLEDMKNHVVILFSFNIKYMLQQWTLAIGRPLLNFVHSFDTRCRGI